MKFVSFQFAPEFRALLHMSAQWEGADLTHHSSRLGCVGLMLSMLATGPKVRGFKPCQGDGFLKAIKIHSTPSSRMGTKVGGPMS
jgi:hypothetical protein